MYKAKEDNMKEMKNTFLTNVHCPRCQNYLHTTDIKGYTYVCTECDENYYRGEVNEPELIEISIPMTSKNYKAKREKLRELNSDFLGYCEITHCVDLGWDKKNTIHMYDIASKLEEIVYEGKPPLTYPDIINTLPKSPLYRGKAVGIWTNGEDILCETEMLAACVAKFLECMNVTDCVVTGYYDPVEDERSNEMDECTGFYYVTCN